MIEKHYQRLLTNEGFFAQYIVFLAEYANEKGQCEKAYDATERMYFSVFGKNKFKNYEVFRVTKTNFHKKRKK